MGAVPVKPSGGVPLSCLTDVSIYPLTSVVNPFFQKNFWGNFFKDNENARARSGSQNRRKQEKTEVLSAEKFLKKSEKTRKKDFSRRAARLFFENSALYRADLSRPAYTVPAPLSRRSDSGQGTSIVC